MDDTQEREVARGGGSTFIERLADKVGARAGTTSVYAEPVERDGVVVIPVAKVRWGFGGGWGGKGSDERGAGGGGGMRASPVGYVEIRQGRAEFRPIRDPAAWVPLMVAGAFTSWLVVRALQRLFRA
jgi:uncharacterized spore protein YtfJ